MISFGLSTTFWGLNSQVRMQKFMLGLRKNVDVGLVPSSPKPRRIIERQHCVTKGMMGELTDSTNMAQVFAFIPLIGLLEGL